MIEFIKKQGYRVFVSEKTNPTYCYYSDGKNVGYAQWSDFRAYVGTVHIPNKQTGTGFSVADAITEGSLKSGFAMLPSWASGTDRGFVVKYSDLDHWLSSRSIVKMIEV